MSHELLRETPSQTAGPYVHIGLALAAAGNPTRDLEIWNRMAREDAPGQHILLLGHVYDGNGHLVRDSFLEFWQADSEGRYQERYDPERPFNSFGRTATTFDAGEWTLHTVKPGVVRNAQGVPMAPTSTSRCSPAASTSTCRPGCTSMTRPRPTPPVRCST